jgi:transcription initiation factor TFIIIB Brf1 subunit/transcription initiation factor TFIIB
MVDIQTIWDQFDSLTKGTESVEQYNEYICKCGGAKYFANGEYPVCTTCGLVEDFYVSTEPEWTSGIDADGNVSDPSRCGGPVNTGFFSENWNMGTIISTRGKSYAVKKMSRIHFHTSMNHRDRALFHAYAEIEKAGREKLGCSDVIIDTAKILYKEFTEKKLTRGDVRAGVKANCLFLACKKFGYPRTTKEVADALNIDTKDVGRTSNILKDTLSENDPITITKPRDVVARIFNEFDIEDKTKERMKVIKFCDLIERKPELMGKTPSGIASAAIYIVMRGKISKVEICKASGISLPTLNKIEAIIKTFS